MIWIYVEYIFLNNMLLCCFGNPTEIPVDDVLMASSLSIYDFERDKRINARPEGNEQYINPY